MFQTWKDKSRRGGTAGRLLAVAGLMSGLVAGSILLTGAPASATSLTQVNWSVSNNATSSAANGVTGYGDYTWNFITATSSTPTQITFTVPSGTILPASPQVMLFGLATCVPGSLTLLSGTVTLPLSSCGTVAAGQAVEVKISGASSDSGFTNTSTAGSYTSVVTLSSGDTGTSNSVSFNSNTTAISVIVPETLDFTNTNPAVELLPIPGGGTVTGDVQPTLGVSSNAGTGYTLSGCAGSLSGPDSSSIPEASNTTAGNLSGNFGAEAAFTPGSVHGTTAQLSSPWSSTGGGDFLGYNSSCGTDPGQAIATDSGPDAGDTLTLTEGVNVSATQTAGSYTGTVSYELVPSY